MGEDLVLDTFSKVGVRFVFTKVFKWQDGNAFLRDRRTGRSWLDRGVFLTRKFALQLIRDLLVATALLMVSAKEGGAVAVG